MANKKKNPEVAPTPEQRSRAASSSRKKQRKTYVSKTVKIVLVVIGVLAMLLSVSAMACSGLMSQSESASSGYKLTGGVAATINGTNLTEASGCPAGRPEALAFFSSPFVNLQHLRR